MLKLCNSLTSVMEINTPYCDPHLWIRAEAQVGARQGLVHLIVIILVFIPAVVGLIVLSQRIGLGVVKRLERGAGLRRYWGRM